MTLLFSVIMILHRKSSDLSGGRANGNVERSPGSEGSDMTRQEVYREIEDMFGLVPSMFKAVPDGSLELEWKLFKQVQFAEGAIPNKYRELIGVAISAITKCRYCSFFHTEIAKLNGATEAEIEDAVHFAKSSAGWSAYVNGLQLDYDQFRDEVLQACEHVRVAQTKGGQRGK
jgi:AhpD family alkylhydroperoxidase